MRPAPSRPCPGSACDPRGRRGSPPPGGLTGGPLGPTLRGLSTVRPPGLLWAQTSLPGLPTCTAPSLQGQGSTERGCGGPCAGWWGVAEAQPQRRPELAPSACPVLATHTSVSVPGGRAPSLERGRPLGSLPPSESCQPQPSINGHEFRRSEGALDLQHCLRGFPEHSLRCSGHLLEPRPSRCGQDLQPSAPRWTLPCWQDCTPAHAPPGWRAHTEHRPHLSGQLPRVLAGVCVCLADLDQLSL